MQYCVQFSGGWPTWSGDHLFRTRPVGTVWFGEVVAALFRMAQSSSTIMKILLLLLSQMTSTAALVAGHHASFSRFSQLSMPLVVMNDCASGGFNSFRRWPTASKVVLTSNAQSFFGLEDTSSTFDELRASKACNSKECNAEVLEKLMASMPLADQRGEKVVLNVDEQGHLEWNKVV